jgi:hypothetical protein
MQARQS